jgi:hypothetical protein
VAWLAKTVLTEEEKRSIKVVALELFEIRKLVNQLAETLANLSDKELLKVLNANQDDLDEHQVDSYKLRLEKQLDVVEREFNM